MQSVIQVILEKGGLGYALFLAMAWYWARDRDKLEAQINQRDVRLAEIQAMRVADTQKIAELHGLRVADLQKSGDTAWQANAKLVEIVSRNTDTMEEVRDLLDGQTDPRRSKRDERE